MELKPCPFCNCELEYDGNDILGRRYIHPVNDCFLVELFESGCIIVHGDEYEKWNRMVEDGK